MFFSKEFNFIMTIFHVRGLFFVTGQLPVADEKRVYKTIPTIVSAEASAIVKCRNGNNDDETDPKFGEK